MYYYKGNTRNFGWNRGGALKNVFQRTKPAISEKWQDETKVTIEDQ